MISLNSAVGDLKMVGPVFRERLLKLNIHTVNDLLEHIPFRYDDFSLNSPIVHLQEGETATVSGIIVKFNNIYTKTGKKIQKIILADESGSIALVFFNAFYLNNILRTGMHISVSGTLKMYIKELAFLQPSYEISNSDNLQLHTGRIVPVYPETEGISSKWFRFRISVLLNKLNLEINDFLPREIISKFKLVPYSDALHLIHFPQNQSQINSARERLVLNELIVLQLASLIRKKTQAQLISPFVITPQRIQDKINLFIKNLPFTLTESQNKAVEEIFADLSKGTPMNRLLQGDVGSGKTAVVIICAYFIFLNGYQTVFMAPTEILAGQHYRTFKKLFAKYKIKISLIVGNSGKKGKKTENSDIYIGTHAILFRTFPKSKIALVVIDEQQRFGVSQRAGLKLISNNPHFLALTATPIPRTVALTLYADLDMSVMSELPSGRLRVKTYVVAPEKRTAAYNWLKEKILSTRVRQQVFIICPFIEESESLLTVKSAKKEYTRLKEQIFPEFKLGLVHGRQSSAEKNKFITGFNKGLFDILVATPVVEVGMDIENATVIIIEAADRFGLSQLHQLRGRVGRNNSQSYCLLFTEIDRQETMERLKILEKNHIGIKIAEYDLKVRGPGEFFGLRQHGSLGLKFSAMSDLHLISRAKLIATDILNTDPDLKKLRLLREKVFPFTIQNISSD